MIIIGIAGGTGSGKTTVVTKIANSLPQKHITILPQDAYYKDNAHLTFDERKKINYDHPNSIDFDLMLQHINKLKNGESIEQPLYSYTTHSRSEDYKVVHPRNFGIYQ